MAGSRVCLLNSECLLVQADGRIRRGRRVPEMNHRYLRVILLSDRETVHNAFLDRGFVP